MTTEPDTQQTAVEKHPDPERRWRHRRWMAWASLVGQLVFPFVAIGSTYFGIDPAAVAGNVVWPFYVGTGSVVGLYIGSCVWESVSIGVGS